MNTFLKVKYKANKILYNRLLVIKEKYSYHSFFLLFLDTKRR